MEGEFILCATRFKISMNLNLKECPLATPQTTFKHHTLGIECKGMLSTRVDRMPVGNRVGDGLTRSTISSFAPI